MVPVAAVAEAVAEVERQKPAVAEGVARCNTAVPVEQRLAPVS